MIINNTEAAKTLKHRLATALAIANSLANDMAGDSDEDYEYADLSEIEILGLITDELVECSSLLSVSMGGVNTESARILESMLGTALAIATGLINDMAGNSDDEYQDTYLSQLDILGLMIEGLEECSNLLTVSMGGVQ